MTVDPFPMINGRIKSLLVLIVLISVIPSRFISFRLFTTVFFRETTTFSLRPRPIITLVLSIF
ncbi:uncharacterized protein FA14DRAFT_186325 [Meira miltonrushii]|uniref:Uncharacterized protein n=1 Tax=Meira miltonrushii TaxID=1280837 RepID=A0A316V7S5_9BASI|nr:uncharacterized protein FA14DRAFT_186325 [Meira miltonrushii]PWN31495.1 hypothetical protein FA14DRAFT_186325 [Meira miltonrushii]